MKPVAAREERPQGRLPRPLERETIFEYISARSPITRSSCDE
jgi:hypothetical protein